jgi:hypothetical protein
MQEDILLLCQEAAVEIVSHFIERVAVNKRAEANGTHELNG